jgi:hypothetical protein
MADPVVTFIDVSDIVKEVIPIGIVLEHSFYFLAAGADVQHGAGKFYASGAGHKRTTTQLGRHGKKVDLIII